MTRLFNWKGHAIIGFGARGYLGVVFLMACWHKLLEPQSFAVDIATYQILPLVLVNPMAIILPWIELVAGLMFLVGWRNKPAALLVSGMMTMFIVAIVLALHKGLDMSCGCFASQGATDDPISILTVARDLGWLLLAAYIAVFDRGVIGIDGWRSRRPVQPGDKQGVK